MGFIYKITNQVNGKVYIGQTIKTVEKRFQQHKNNSNKPYFSQLVLYKAFNKYGIDAFTCETVEEVQNDKLDEREKFWIKYYGSYRNGYNSTLGGRAVTLYNWDVEDIIERYHLLKSARAVALEFGCDHSTIDHILNANNIRRYTQAEQKGRPILLIKQDVKYYFETPEAAAIWLIQTKQTKSSSVRNVRQYISQYAREERKNNTYLGYQIRYYEGEQDIVSPSGDRG